MLSLLIHVAGDARHRVIQEAERKVKADQARQKVTQSWPGLNNGKTTLPLPWADYKPSPALNESVTAAHAAGEQARAGLLPWSEAIQAYTASLALTEIPDSIAVNAVAHGGTLLPKDPRRLIPSQLYIERSKAQVADRQTLSALQDATDGCLLSVNQPFALKQFAMAAGYLAGRGEFWPGQMQKIAHALAADAYDMVVAALPDDEDARDKLAKHLSLAGSTHPKNAPRERKAQHKALDGVLVNGTLDGEPAPYAKLAEALIIITTFWFGLRNADPFSWTPKYLLDSLINERLVEVWLLRHVQMAHRDEARKVKNDRARYERLTAKKILERQISEDADRQSGDVQIEEGEPTEGPVEPGPVHAEPGQMPMSEEMRKAALRAAVEQSIAKVKRRQRSEDIRRRSTGGKAAVTKEDNDDGDEIEYLTDNVEENGNEGGKDEL